MSDYDLYGGTPPHEATDTSFAAAESMAATADKLAAEVRAWIVKQPQGATCDEVEAALNLRHQTASARIRELVLKNLLVDSGGRRRTRARRLAIVWEPCDEPQTTARVWLTSAMKAELRIIVAKAQREGTQVSSDLCTWLGLPSDIIESWLCGDD